MIYKVFRMDIDLPALTPARMEKYMRFGRRATITSLQRRGRLFMVLRLTPWPCEK